MRRSTERSESGVAVTLEFDRATGSRLSIRSDVPKRLANGHRELLTVRAADGSVVLERLLDAQSGDVAVDLAAMAARRQAAGEFFGLGLRHILGGYDHLLFLVALLLGVCRLRSVVTTVTAFTLAHSVTLSLAVLGLVAAPPAIVEPLIAASIVFVGIENLVRDPGASRWKLTFAFGLVHGFGFAGALRDLGIGTDGAGVAVPLACFNAGVEAGQIAVVVALLADSPRAERQTRMAPQVRAGDIARHHRGRRLLAGGASDALSGDSRLPNATGTRGAQIGARPPTASHCRCRRPVDCSFLLRCILRAAVAQTKVTVSPVRSSPRNTSARLAP